MNEFEGYLSDELLQQVRDAAVEARLATDEMLAALVAGIEPLYVATIPAGGSPLARLVQQLHRMNGDHNLRNGDVPLVQWLHQAIFLAGGTPAAEVFETALDHCLHAPAAPPPTGADGPGAAPPDTAAGPAGPPLSPGPDAASPAEPEPNFELQPEAQIAGSDATVEIGFLEGALASAKSVVKLLVHRHDDGQPMFLQGDTPWLVNGTGWFVAPLLVITNHHVVNARRRFPVPEPDAPDADLKLQGESTTVIYDYLSKDSGGVKVRTGVGALVAWHRDLDFALLRLPANAESRPPLRLRRHTIRKRVEQALGTRVNVLQHPNGDPMRLGFRDNFVVIGDESLLSYLTDTNLGSSGSPVCDDAWSVAALHSGSRNISAQGIEIRGRPVRRENFGTPIKRIMDHLAANHPELHQEIEAAQS